MDSVAAVAVSAMAISSGEKPVWSDNSWMVGSLPSSVVSLFRTLLTEAACSFRLLETFSVPSSLRKRRISPEIFGTA